MDLIDRQAAVDTIRNATFSFVIKEEIQEIFNNILDAQEKALKELPPAKQSVGEWIITKELDEDVATCPFCGAEMRRKSTGEKPEPPNFCHSCGADLRGEKKQ